MGYADACLLSGQPSNPEETITEKQTEVRDWSLTQFTESDLEYIREFFQPLIEIRLLNNQKLVSFHGSPASFNDVILPATEEEKDPKVLQRF